MKTNIKKSRFAALLSVMLIVCFMTAMLAVPVSASEVSVEFQKYKIPYKEVLTAYLKEYKFPLHADTYSDMAAYIMESNGTDENAIFLVFVDIATQTAYIKHDGLYATYHFVYKNEKHVFSGDYFTYFDTSEEDYLDMYPIANIDLRNATPTSTVAYSGEFVYASHAANGQIASSIGENSLSGVLDEIVNLLPVVIPVIIGFIGLDKAIKFITGVLHSA